MYICVGTNSTVEYGTPEFEAAKTELKAKVDAAYAALNEATSVADKYGLEFTFEPTYGMGGSYTGQGSSEEPECEDTYDWEDNSWGWYASSQSC